MWAYIPCLWIGTQNIGKAFVSPKLTQRLDVNLKNKTTILKKSNDILIYAWINQVVTVLGN